MKKDKKKKKGILATIWESMTKTGGCCGSGESCCGPSGEKEKDVCQDKGKKEEKSFKSD